MRFLIVLLLLALRVSADEPFRPTFAYDVDAPQANTIIPLLRAACGDGVRTVTADGRNAFGCGDGSMDEILASRGLQRKYPWMPYVLWEADGVTFGHFLSPESEDVAISCFGCQTHPYLWGGTLLLTRQSDKWKPVWFKAGVITRHCRRVSLATGRQILLCEETDGGMGHSLHGLYTIDFTKPKFAWRSVVLMADSYNSPTLGGLQTQSIDRVSFEECPDGNQLIRVYARHGRILQGLWDPVSLRKPKISKYEIDFRLEGESFQVTPETAAAGRLFRFK